MEILISGRHFRLAVRAVRKDGGILKAPRHGGMDRDIQESIVSRIYLELSDREGKVLYADEGLHAGLEIVGDVSRYFPPNP